MSHGCKILNDSSQNKLLLVLLQNKIFQSRAESDAGFVGESRSRVEGNDVIADLYRSSIRGNTKGDVNILLVAVWIACYQHPLESYRHKVGEIKVSFLVYSGLFLFILPMGCLSRYGEW